MTPCFIGFDDYLKKLTPEDNERNLWFRDYWEDTFECDVDEDRMEERKNRGFFTGLFDLDSRKRRERRKLCDPGQR